MTLFTIVRRLSVRTVVYSSTELPPVVKPHMHYDSGCGLLQRALLFQTQSARGWACEACFQSESFPWAIRSGHSGCIRLPKDKNDI